MRDHVAEGQEVQVKVLDIDRQGRIRLSMKEVTVATNDIQETAEAPAASAESVGTADTTDS